MSHHASKYDVDRFRRSVTNHTPPPEALDRIRRIRAEAVRLVEWIADPATYGPPPEAQAVGVTADEAELHRWSVADEARDEAIRHVERAVMYATKAIAIAHGEPTDGALVEGGAR